MRVELCLWFVVVMLVSCCLVVVPEVELSCPQFLDYAAECLGGVIIRCCVLVAAARRGGPILAPSLA